MDEILAALKSPLWWLSTFVFSFVVNAATPWITGIVSKRFAVWGKVRRAKKERRDNRFKSLAVDAALDSRVFALVVANEQALLWRATFILAFSGVAVAFAILFNVVEGTPIIKAGASGIALGIGIVAAIGSVQCVTESLAYRSIINQTTKAVRIQLAMERRAAAAKADVQPLHPLWN